MKLTKYFKLFESRSANLSKDEFFKLLRENCKDYINNPKAIQRMKNSIEEYSYVNPKIHSRTQGKADIAKAIMLFMDNLESWKDYPKRENSIIGISTLTGGDDFSYGEEFYLIIPYDGAKFGIAPADDLWSSKVKIDDDNYIMFSNFQSLLGDIVSAPQIRSPHSPYSPASYSELISELQKAYDVYLNDSESLKMESGFYLKSAKMIFDLFVKDNVKNVEDGINKLLSPNNLYGGLDKDNMFKLHSYNELDDKRCEVWTDSECLLFHLGSYSECYECGNSGMMACGECYGQGEVDCEKCNDGNYECEKCNGDGCESCDNKGYIDCEECHYGKVQCSDCNDGELECNYCNGMANGIVTAEHANDLFDMFINKIKN